MSCTLAQLSLALSHQARTSPLSLFFFSLVIFVPVTVKYQQQIRHFFFFFFLISVHFSASSEQAAKRRCVSAGSASRGLRYSAAAFKKENEAVGSFATQSLPRSRSSSLLVGRLAYSGRETWIESETQPSSSPKKKKKGEWYGLIHSDLRVVPRRASWIAIQTHQML